MAKSLAEQLMGAGLVDKKKVDQARKDKRKQAKQDKAKGRKADVADDTQQRLQQQRAEQVERDRQLNLQRLAREKDKALRAQVRQMLQHGEQKVKGDIRFNFKDPRSNRIKQLYVTAAVHSRLTAGQLAICLDEENFVVVPRVIADKIAERLPAAVIFVADQQAGQVDEDDPYKDFPIPDDLMW